VTPKTRKRSDQYRGEKIVPSTSSFTPRPLAGYVRKDVHHGIDQERDENAGDTNHPFEQDSQDIPFCIFEETSA
jgi:hypothetical protein